jgi:hypothetical protein
LGHDLSADMTLRMGKHSKLERQHEPLLPRQQFLVRLLRYLAIAAGIVAGSLSIGILGYRWLGELAWIDALLNASFILTGMGPVDPLKTVSGKLFASAYAIFSGIAFLSTIGVMLTPVVHRFLHRFHLQIDQDR